MPKNCPVFLSPEFGFIELMKSFLCQLLFVLCGGLSLAVAQTPVFDYQIDEPTIWTAEMSPYLLYQSLHIGPKGSLVLAAGVELRFDGFEGIIVEGRLETQGTDAQPVVMGPLIADKDVRWQGIRVMGPKAALSLGFTNILLAETGVEIQSSGPQGIDLQDCLFASGTTGLRLMGVPPTFTASRNAFLQNQVGLEFAVGGTYKGFQANEICTNQRYQAVMTTAESVKLPSNCWCDLDGRGTDQRNGILDRRRQAGLGSLSFTNASVCDIPNQLAAFAKGGGDVTVVLDDYVSTEAIGNIARAFDVYPQPMQDRLFIELGEAWQGPLELSAFDLQGRLLWRRTYLPDPKLELDRSDLPSSGLYILQLRDTNGVVEQKKIIVQ